VPRFINFLLVGLHTRVFHPESYSVVTEILSYTAVLNTLYTFGMETAYFRFSTKPGADENQIYNLTQTVVLAISGFSSVLLLIFSSSIATALAAYYPMACDTDVYRCGGCHSLCST
jgi:O-antigen/teichoic acid export membrane protein